MTVTWVGVTHFPCKNGLNQFLKSKLKYGKNPTNEKLWGAQEKAWGAQPVDAQNSTCRGRQSGGVG
jgi:hypothetical protein